ncbi:hypothetical protein OEZ85_002426 [Tetradesmus obliquus]|uniref:Uncharacterized protein n=1 Tax=Tetradesmus obliquus TaxID=3088 RepID=A0ABY8TXG6_TETOB|nr:hypothetical protein OEZ85_002426 [Tetradesmus obliquus]
MRSATALQGRVCTCWCPQLQHSPHHRRLLVARPAVERDLDWDPAIKRGPVTAPPRGSPPPPPPPPPPPKTGLDWLEVPFKSRRNIVISMVVGTSAVWFWNKKVLPPVDIGTPPADFPFQLAGYTDIAPEEFVYARTPQGNWVASAADPGGRVFVIDQAGDLYYDSGNPQVGVYALDPQGNLFNIYRDESGQRTITPVGNISQMQRFKISEIAGLKLDNDVTIVAMADGSSVPLPPGSGMVNKDGKFVPPGELVEGVQLAPPDNPFARLMGKSPAYDVNRYEVDPNDPRPYDRQLYDQTLLDDPDLPGYQPALPRGFSLTDLAREVEAEEQARAKRRRSPF